MLSAECGSVSILRTTTSSGFLYNFSFIVEMMSASSGFNLLFCFERRKNNSKLHIFKGLLKGSCAEICYQFMKNFRDLSRKMYIVVNSIRKYTFSRVNHASTLKWESHLSAKTQFCQMDAVAECDQIFSIHIHFLIDVLITPRRSIKDFYLWNQWSQYCKKPFLLIISTNDRTHSH